MPEYLTPGVYVEEIERGPKPIEGVPTSTSAFLGETERGPIRPRLVTSYTEYNRWFGGVFADGRYMPHVASGFFENGGKRLYVCRIVGDGANTANKTFGDFVVRAAGQARGDESLGQVRRWINERRGRQQWLSREVRLTGPLPRTDSPLTIRFWRRIARSCRALSTSKTTMIYRLIRSLQTISPKG
jgi:hypothetical protein